MPFLPLTSSSAEARKMTYTAVAQQSKASRYGVAIQAKLHRHWTQVRKVGSGHQHQPPQ